MNIKIKLLDMIFTKNTCKLVFFKNKTIVYQQLLWSGLIFLKDDYFKNDKVRIFSIILYTCF